MSPTPNIPKIKPIQSHGLPVAMRLAMQAVAVHEITGTLMQTSTGFMLLNDSGRSMFQTASDRPDKQTRPAISPKHTNHVAKAQVKLSAHILRIAAARNRLVT